MFTRLYAPRISLRPSTDDQRALDIMEKGDGAVQPLRSFSHALSMLEPKESNRRAFPFNPSTSYADISSATTLSAEGQNSVKTDPLYAADSLHPTALEGCDDSVGMLGVFAVAIKSVSLGLSWPNSSDLQLPTSQNAPPPGFRDTSKCSAVPPNSESVCVSNGIPNGTLVLPGTHATPSINVRQPTHHDKNTEFQLLIDAGGDWCRTIPEKVPVKGFRPMEDFQYLTAYTLNPEYIYPDPRSDEDASWKKFEDKCLKLAAAPQSSHQGKSTSQLAQRCTRPLRTMKRSMSFPWPKKSKVEEIVKSG